MITLALTLVIVGLDQLAKHLVQAHLILGQAVALLPGFFNLTHTRNTGAVWGTLQHQNAWLTIFSLLALGLIAFCYRWLVDARRVHRLALGLMLGGVLGNLIDRVRLGWVVDFLDVYWRNHHWPTFNLADAAIFLGVAAYLISAWRGASAAAGADG